MDSSADEKVDVTLELLRSISREEPKMPHEEEETNARELEEDGRSLARIFLRNRDGATPDTTIRLQSIDSSVFKDIGKHFEDNRYNVEISMRYLYKLQKQNTII